MRVVRPSEVPADPKYLPPSNEVFHSMEGISLINVEPTRLAKLPGELMSDVDFGFENSGELRKG